MARMHPWIGLAVLALFLSGCVVGQDKFDALKLERDQLRERGATLENQLATARVEADAYKNQLASLGTATGGKDALLANQATQIAELQKQLDEINRKYTDALGRVQSGPALSQPLTNELTAFARQNPDLVDFDASRGIVKFKSDLTFALGSADLTPKAKDAIVRFASILNSPAASGYELMVAGHTDNIPVSNPATIAKGHLNNWYLSSHRAITVGNELLHQRVSAQRLAVVGYADQRPIASNASDMGRAQNRRVEVLILPTTVRGAGVASGSAPKAAPVAKPHLNKDTTHVDNRPALNK